MSDINDNISSYYTNKFNKYGSTPKGVDWNGEESQLIRFKQLSKVFCNNNVLSVNDIGCGYGKYVDYLKTNNFRATYTGYDLCDDMIDAARCLHPDSLFVKVDQELFFQQADYSIASGIFNVKMFYSESMWLSHVINVLNKINSSSQRGFSFNMLTKYSDGEFMKDNLYYADPLFFFDYCKKNFSRNISLNHDYDLYEFTILVRKD